MANELITQVLGRIGTMQTEQGLTLPPDYSAANALNAAWLMLTDDTKGQPLAQKTTQKSQAQALLNMTIQGLSPAKSQGYFIAYGQQLSFQRSYFGSITILKRLPEVKDVWAEVVHKGDVFKISGRDGRVIVSEFEPSFENQDNDIIGAFAVIVKNDGERIYTVMTKKEIDQSWSHSRNRKVQNEFPQEMAQRTVLNRAAKMFINTSTDNDMLIKSMNDTTAEANDFSERKDVTERDSGHRSVTDLISTAKSSVTEQKAAEEQPQLNKEEVMNYDGDDGEAAGDYAGYSEGDGQFDLLDETGMVPDQG